jgi:hypothetical protein
MDPAAAKTVFHAHNLCIRNSALVVVSPVTAACLPVLRECGLRVSHTRGQTSCLLKCVMYSTATGPEMNVAGEVERGQRRKINIRSSVVQAIEPLLRRAAQPSVFEDKSLPRPAG